MYAPYFGGVKLLHKEFIDHCKNNPNKPQKFPTEIKKNIYIIALEESSYMQMFLSH